MNVARRRCGEGERDEGEESFQTVYEFRMLAEDNLLFLMKNKGINTIIS